VNPDDLPGQRTDKRSTMLQPGGVLNEMPRFLARHGLRKTLRAVGRRMVYARTRVVIINSTLAGPPFDPGADGLVFREATADDLAALDTLAPFHQADQLRAFVEEDGERLHIARDGGRIVGFRRVSRNLSQRGILARVLHLTPEQVVTADLFVHPDYRNRNVGRRLALAQDRALAGCGFKEMLSGVDIDNVASLRMSFRKGSRPVCVVSYHRLLFYQRCDVSRSLPPEVQRILDEVVSGESR
jgi:GNAT superfamily N-acetyltransferase